MLQSILSNIAIILLMHLLISTVIHFQDKYSKFTREVIIIIITSLSVIAMFYLPIKIYDDFWVDMRLIPLVFLAYFHGWRVAIPSLIIAALWRVGMGGGGMMPGIVFGMVLPTFFALLFHHRINLKGKYLEKVGIIFVAWFMSDFPIIFFMPNGLNVFQQIAIPRCLTIVLTSIILFIFIIHDRERRFLHDKFEKLAGEDFLTKLLNKRKFLEVVEKKCSRVQSNQFLAMFDIDHFKKVNDTFGHIVGDAILIELGEILKNYEQENVVIGRYGGEEFIIYFEKDNYSEVIEIMNSIRNEIQRNLFALDRGEPIRVTISTGLAKLDKNMSLEEGIALADQCLYKAKANGRNCIITDQQEEMIYS